MIKWSIIGFACFGLFIGAGILLSGDSAFQDCMERWGGNPDWTTTCRENHPPATAAEAIGGGLLVAFILWAIFLGFAKDWRPQRHVR